MPPLNGEAAAPTIPNWLRGNGENLPGRRDAWDDAPNVYRNNTRCYAIWRPNPWPDLPYFAIKLAIKDNTIVFT